MSMISGVSETLEIELSYEELFKRATFLRSVFPFSVGFLKWVMHKIVSANIDMQSKTSMTKRWNWLWDYQVSFLITEHTLDSRNILLITSDHDIIEMNKEYGFDNKVLTLSEYIEFLK
jgi:hypothetical protein